MKGRRILFLISVGFLLGCNRPKEEIKVVEKKPVSIPAKQTNNKNLPLFNDNPELEKEKIIVYAEEDEDSLIYSRNELNKIEFLFPIFKSKYPLNPNEAYLASDVWKDYINQDRKEIHYTFGSEAGQDQFCLVYTYYLKQKNGEKKYKAEREKLIQLYRAVNGLYEGLNYGGTFFGHQHLRLYGFAEYSIYLLDSNREYYEKEYDFQEQKKIYLKSLKQYVADEESKNVYYEMDLVQAPEKAKQRAKKLNEKIDIIQRLTTNYFYLNQVQNFEMNYK